MKNEWQGGGCGDGGGGCNKCQQNPCCCGINLQGGCYSLEEVANYIIRAQQQALFQGQYDNNGGQPPFNPSPVVGISWAQLSFNANQPLQIIGIAPIDGLYEINLAIVCKTSDAGATLMTLTAQYQDVVAGLESPDITLVGTSAAVSIASTTHAVLLGGSPILASAILTGAYGAATFDVFVSFRKLA
jgi:hypothetical protein